MPRALGMTAMLVAAAVAVGLALGGGEVVGAAGDVGDRSVCERLDDAEITVVGEVGDPDLDEISGLAASRRHPGILWAHNDSGDSARVFALDETGRKLGEFVLAGADHVDWEDVAVGPGPDGEPHLFVGDIGQNIALREPAVVYRVPEPTERPADDGVLAEVDRLELVYPDGPADAETLLVDPETGELVVITKSLDGASRILTAPADALSPGAPITMTEAGTITFTDPGPVDGAPLPGTMLTGGAIAPDRSFIALRTYKEILLFPWEGSVVDTLGREPCARTIENEPQGEAVAVTADSTALVTISEFGFSPDPPVPVHRLELDAPDDDVDGGDPTVGSAGETTVDGSAGAPPTADGSHDAPDADVRDGTDGSESSGGGMTTVVLVLAVTGAGLAVALVVRRRRGAS